ncbi:MAG TPA: AI-2E family transporter [Candidatus Tumulicola sp.]
MNAQLWRRIGWTVAIICVLLGALWVAEHIPRTLTIFTIAAFIAFGVVPVANRLEKRMPKPLAIATVFAVLLIAIALGMFIVVPLTISQVQLLATNLPGYAAATQGWLSGAEDSLSRHFPQLQLPMQNFSVTSFSGSKLSVLVTGVLASLGTLAFNAATGLFVAFSAIILSFFFLLNDKQIGDWFAGMFPPNRRETARKLSAEVTQLFGSYIAGQIAVSAITGFVIAVASAIIGFKFSLILGIISGVAYAIPIIGMLIAEIIAVPMCLPQGIGMTIWVQVIMFGMARISDNVLVPKIMGESVGVSPIGAMFAVFAGGELFGIPGLILGIPMAALVKILWRYFMAPWLHAQLDRS